MHEGDDKFISIDSIIKYLTKKVIDENLVDVKKHIKKMSSIGNFYKISNVIEFETVLGQLRKATKVTNSNEQRTVFILNKSHFDSKTIEILLQFYEKLKKTVNFYK